MGTCNAHIAIGPQCYIEIIGRDPDQPDFRGPRPFGIGRIGRPRLMSWAARLSGLPDFAQYAESNGVVLGAVMSMSRVAPEDETLEWTLTYPLEADQAHANVVPFFIDWGRTPHPASRCRGAGQLVKLELQHPEPEEIGRIAEILGIDANISSGAKPKILAHIRCPRGEVVLS